MPKAAMVPRIVARREERTARISEFISSGSSTCPETVPRTGKKVKLLKTAMSIPLLKEAHRQHDHRI
jgi:hypothetical protein